MAFVREGRHTERGFTLIELMVVVAIVAILAMVVVPSFMKSGTKSKARTEVSGMFAEIASKQEQYRAENNNYLGNPSGTNKVGTSTCPATVPTADYTVTSSTCWTAGTAWPLLRVNPTSATLRCQYTIEAGLRGVAWTPPTGFVNSSNAAAAEPTPASGWWYIHAKCDHTGSTGFAEYYTSSVDRRLQSRNEGN